MDILIRKAAPGEEAAVLDFYNNLIDGMKGAKYPIRWVRDVYPVLNDIKKAVADEGLYIALASVQDLQEAMSGKKSGADENPEDGSKRQSGSADRNSSEGNSSVGKNSQQGTISDNEIIIGAFILNHQQSEGYELVHWKVPAEPEKVTVVHLLATSPACQSHGLGHRMLSEAVRICRSRGDKAIRLDTLTWNVPGKTLYEHFGFAYCGDISLYYPTTGDLPFSMYEFSLT